MKKGFFCFIYVLIVGATIFAQQPVIAEAPPLLIMNPLTPDEVNTVGGVFGKMLPEVKSFRIINKLVLEKGMRDYLFQPKDWTNAEKTIDLCEALNIDWVIRPQLFKRASTRNDGEIIMTTVLFNIRTKEIKYTTPVALKNPTEAHNKMEAHINEITQIVTDGTGGLTQSDQSVYKIGDRGPAGGWIYHDKGKYSDGWRYLEVAPQATETSVERSKIVERIPGSDMGIGVGKKNTELILKSPNQDYQIVKAAKICASMELNWFKDWFLPSWQELQWFTSHSNNNFAGFSIGYYWSSSDSDNSVMFAIAGSKMPDRNQPSYLVRAVRAF